MMRRKFNKLKKLWKDTSGMGTVEMILIIVVLIGLVLIFKTQIRQFLKRFQRTALLFCPDERVFNNIPCPVPFAAHGIYIAAYRKCN